MCQRNTTICPHCQKHYDEAVKVEKEPTWQLIVALLVLVMMCAVAGAFVGKALYKKFHPTNVYIPGAHLKSTP